MKNVKTTIGVDVGGLRKGFHAVLNYSGKYSGQFHSRDADEMASWILKQQPSVVAIDAPCMFSLNGKSREAERNLVKNGIRCFYTPTRELAIKSSFYDWVFNGETLYQKLNLPIFMGAKTEMPCIIETFPHGVHLSLWAREPESISDGNKFLTRKLTLTQKANYEIGQLNSQDFIDAALCAISADYFVDRQVTAYGSSEEGFIVLPNLFI